MVTQKDSGDEIIDLYRCMFVYREFENVVARATANGEIQGEMHLAIGHEVGAAVLASLLNPGDAVVSTHRNHLHALAAGVDPVLLLAELRERDGLNHGKGGHMHLFDSHNRFMATGIVGASAPPALGYAFTQRYRGEDSITVCVLGDATMNQGAVFESMNLAAVRNLPVLFLVEDNKFGISVRTETSTAGKLEDRGSIFGIPGFRADGSDHEDTRATLTEAARIVREERRPALAVIDVVRMRGHYEGDPDTYRSADERPEQGSEGDPLTSVRRILVDYWNISEATLSGVEVEAAAEVASWDAASLLLPMPDPTQARKGVFFDE